MTEQPRTVTSTIADVLRREGISFLSAYPTSPLIDAAATLGMRPILCRQERVGVGIADGYSRVSHGAPPGVFAMQMGPGVENAHSGITTAFADSVPTLLLPLGYPDDRLDHPRYYHADRLRRSAKSVERIRDPRDVAEVMRRAFSRLRNGRPGPVVVEIPHPLAHVGVPEGAPEYVPASSCRVAGDPAAIDAAARRLADAERPVSMAGQGVLYAGATGELVALAEFLDAPTATTLEGKSAFPETHRLSLGTGGATMPVPLRDVLAEADVVVGVGTSFTKHYMVIDPPEGKVIIHITNDEDDLNKDCRSDFPIVGDAQLVLGDLLAVLRERLGGEGVRRGAAEDVRRRRDAWMAEWTSRLTSQERPINPYRVVGAMRKVLDPERSIVTHDSGSPRDQLVPFYPAVVPHGYLSWGKSHALGTGLGLIMGAKLAAPERVCVNVMGDAAFGMVGLDFETAVRNAIPITTVVLNNGTMACESDHLTVSHERYGARDIGGNYADIARALGGWALRVEHPAELEGAFEKAIRANEEGQAALLEIITSPRKTPFSVSTRERPPSPDAHGGGEDG